MFGEEYQLESKLSIKLVKETVMDKLKMQEAAALDFARFLIEQNTSNPCTQAVEHNNSASYVTVDQTRTAQALKVMLTINLGTDLKAGVHYYGDEKEKKMMLIIGEKLQTPLIKSRLLQTIKNCAKDRFT